VSAVAGWLGSGHVACGGICTAWHDCSSGKHPGLDLVSRLQQLAALQCLHRIACSALLAVHCLQQNLL
jgi:hypothetical protein